MQRQFHILALGCMCCLFSAFYSTLKAQTENHLNTINHESKKEEIDHIIKAFAAINKFNGTALIHYQNKNIIERSYGWQDAEKKIPNQDKSVYQIASLPNLSQLWSL